MAKRRQLNLSNHQNVVVGAAASREQLYHKTTNRIFHGEGFLVAVAIVLCLLSSSSPSIARLTVGNVQRWPNDDYIYLTGKPVEQPARVVSPGQLSRQQQAELEANEQQLLSYNEPPANYFVASEPQYPSSSAIYEPRIEEYLATGHPLDERLDVAEMREQREAQQLASKNSDYFYPLLSSSSSSSATSYPNNNEDSSVEFKSNLADLEHKLSQLQNSANNYDNIDSYDNIKITNPAAHNLQLSNSVESQGIEGRVRDKSGPANSAVQSEAANEQSAGRAFTLLEDDSELLASARDEDDDKTAAAATSTLKNAKEPTTTVSYGTVVTGQAGEPSQASQQGSMLNRMYKKLSGFLPFLSQMSILRNGGESGNRTLEDERAHLSKELARAQPVEPTKQSVSGTRSPEFREEDKKDEKKKSVEAEEQQDDNKISEAGKDKSVSLLRQSAVVMPLKSKDELLQEADKDFEPAESLVGKYIYAPDHNSRNNANEAAKSTPVKKQLSNEYRSSKLSHRAYSSRRLHHQDEADDDDDLDDEALAAEEADEELIGYPPPSRQYRPYYSHTRLIGEPLGSVRQQNKTNDLYFLIMVGSFCAMAVAVVLAAGLFAYRVQQNRKSSTETDYPTYGVVGPNNMTGGLGGGAKLGAASFVGGYFNSNLGAGNNVGILANPSNGANMSVAGKLGTAKHLADLYSISDSGILTATSGSSKSSASSMRRISSDQQQQQQQQHQQQLASNHSTGKGDGKAASVAGSQANAYAVNCQDAARMYHYQHQKQQMIISDRNSGRHNSASDLDSEDENDDGSYTVYECPGLASAHEMEIKNPLFNDDQTP